MNKINNFLRKHYLHKMQLRERQYILKCLQLNNIPNVPVEGEEQYIEKWKKISSNVDPVYYRFFSHYVGNNPNIYSGNLSVQFIEPIMNPLRYRDAFEDKNMYNRMFPESYTPKTYLRRINGVFMDDCYNVQNIKMSDLPSYLAGIKSFVVKPSTDSDSGRGVSLFRLNGNDYINQNNEIFSYDYLLNKYDDNFIIQATIDQSKNLNIFNKTSINTIRIAVFRSFEDNQFHVSNAVLRIGRKDSVIDNAHGGGRSCGLDKNGLLGKYVSNTYGQRDNIFNDIDFKKASFQIPNYERIKEFAIDVANHIPHHRFIALDIALDVNNNPILVEYNIEGFGYWIFQHHGQITFDGYTDQIIDYVSHKKNYILYQKNI